MKNNIFTTKIISFLLVITYFFVFTPNLVTAQINSTPEFNPNNIISNQEMLDVYSLSLSEIQNFLQSQGSYLANYETNNAYGIKKTAAEIIYDAVRFNFDCPKGVLSDEPTEEERLSKCKLISTINPKIILVLLQKEQSLIQKTNPSQKALDEATGYGCPTGQLCNPYWKGFGKQVNSAALQFLAYMQNPGAYGFQVGRTYIAKDKHSMLKEVSKAVMDGTYESIINSPNAITVTIENQATAALYNYTPHVYNGNYNFFNLYNKYFPDNSSNQNANLIYPDGSLLKAENDPGIWLIENSKKRPFLNYTSFISRFHPDQVVIASPQTIASYPQGENIKFPDYSLVQTPNQKIYLLVGNEKRPFDSLETFRNIGFNSAELEEASEAELLGYHIGKEINANSTYITGALLQDTSTGGVYYVENGNKAPLLDRIFLTTKFKDKSILKASPEVLNKYFTIDPILFDDGYLVKSDSFPVVYLISNGQKRAFADEFTFNSLGYKMNNVITVPAKLLYYYPLGEMIQVFN